jgi:hypothetical protein
MMASHTASHDTRTGVNLGVPSVPDLFSPSPLLPSLAARDRVGLNENEMGNEKGRGTADALILGSPSPPW